MSRPAGLGAMREEADQAAAGPDGKLAESLSALANPARLALLRQVRAPRVLSEIDVPRMGGPRDLPDGGVLSRQAVKEHIEKLTSARLLLSRETERGGRSTVEYLVNHQALFALAEELRDLALLRPVVDLSLETRAGAMNEKDPTKLGPCLVLVKGLEEGKAFPLRATEGTSEWVIGRRRGLAVSLDFDPFVSSEHALIGTNGKQHFLRDLESSRNGTRVNFMTIPKGEPVMLRQGDAIGVGRSILLYRQ